MKALVIIAHGSRNRGSNEEIENLISRFKVANSDFDLTAHAFLELTQPDIPSALQTVISQGAKEIFILPYFLARGNHVQADIPDIVNKAAQNHPDISFKVLAHFGSNPDIVSFIHSHISTETATMVAK